MTAIITKQTKKETVIKVTLLSELDAGRREQYVASPLYALLNRFIRYAPVSVRYYGEYFQGRYRDTSLLVWEGHEPVMVLPAYSDAATFSYFGMPTETISVERDVNRLQEIYKAFIKNLKEYLQKNRYHDFLFYDNPYFLDAFFDRIAKPDIEYNAMVDLTLNEDRIKSSLRKSFKSLINWGNRELKTEIITGKNYEDRHITEFRDFHIRVSGKETRSEMTWKIQGEAIKNDQAFIIFSYYRDKLVSASLYARNTKDVSYGVGVYDRDLMAENVPLAHNSLYNAILFAKNNGIENFYLGDIGHDDKTDKEKNISKFKKGFANKCVSRNIYKVHYNGCE